MVKNKYRKILVHFNISKPLKKKIKYLDRKSILAKFFYVLLKTNPATNLLKNDSQKLKIARLPVLYRRLVKDDSLVAGAIISLVKDDYGLSNQIIPNYEEELIRLFGLPPKDIKKYFSYHESYSLIAIMYSEPYQNSPNYQLFVQLYYYLVMYINLELFFNKFVVHEDYKPFLVKLEVQVRMIKALSQLDNVNYNNLVRRLNKWLSNRTIYKALEKENRIKS